MIHVIVRYHPIWFPLLLVITLPTNGWIAITSGRASTHHRLALQQRHGTVRAVARPGTAPGDMSADPSPPTQVAMNHGY